MRFLNFPQTVVFLEASTPRASKESSCPKCVTSSNSFEGGDDFFGRPEKDVGRHVCCVFFYPHQIFGL